MISVDEALALILNEVKPIGTETVSIREGTGRVLAQDIIAKRTHPPFDMSAMDGYAAKTSDIAQGNKLTIIGEAPAGRPFAGRVMDGQAVRIFTGGIMPDGAQSVIIQEDVSRDDDVITITAPQNPPRHIRKAGIDFKTGEVLAEAGTHITALQAGLFAAAGHAEIDVFKTPKIAIFANGDELHEVESDEASGIISSTPVALCEWVKSWGGYPIYCGIARDNFDSLSNVIEKAKTADVIIPLGGASVGDYDLVKTAFDQAGYNNIFSKIAIKPGKPTWFGRLDNSLVLGLPGNPASGLVCAQVFLRPLILSLCGNTQNGLNFSQMTISEDLSPNGSRALFSRGYRQNGCVYALPKQDSSLLSTFAKADCLIFQEPHHQGCKAGESVDILSLND